MYLQPNAGRILNEQSTPIQPIRERDTLQIESPSYRLGCDNYGNRYTGYNRIRFDYASASKFSLDGLIQFGIVQSEDDFFYLVWATLGRLALKTMGFFGM